MGLSVWRDPREHVLHVLKQVDEYCQHRGENIKKFAKSVTEAVDRLDMKGDKDANLMKCVTENLERTMRRIERGEFIVAPHIEDTRRPDPYERDPWVPVVIAKKHLHGIDPSREDLVDFVSAISDRYQSYHDDEGSQALSIAFRNGQRLDAWLATPDELVTEGYDLPRLLNVNNTRFLL
ncbi:hypothetical protein JCM10212_006175 [Sporobolomyces blumeae]